MDNYRESDHPRRRNGEYRNKGGTGIPQTRYSHAQWASDNRERIAGDMRLVQDMGYDGVDSTGETWMFKDPERDGAMLVARRGDTLCCMTDTGLKGMPRDMMGGVSRNGKTYDIKTDFDVPDYPTTLGDREGLFEHATLSDYAPVDFDTGRLRKQLSKVMDDNATAVHREAYMTVNGEGEVNVIDFKRFVSEQRAAASPVTPTSTPVHWTGR
jgi:hypothetical protein